MAKFTFRGLEVKSYRRGFSAPPFSLLWIDGYIKNSVDGIPAHQRSAKAGIRSSEIGLNYELERTSGGWSSGDNTRGIDQKPGRQVGAADDFE